jgi:protein gp37
MHPDWARALRDQCAAAGVPFFFKQWGAWAPTSSVDVYCHGPDRNKRRYPKSGGVAMLADGRICLRDFTVAQHAERMRTGIAGSTRAIEVDHEALADFNTSLMDKGRAHDNPLGLQWMYAVGKKAAGRLLDGVTHDAMPTTTR